MLSSPESRKPHIILASASPRRRELLELLGLEFEVVPSEVDEALPEFVRNPSLEARRLAARKAQSVAELYPGAMVLGADTLVCLGRRLLGKPRDEEDAIRMLKALSGKTHRVITGIALSSQGKTVRGSETTWVTFRPLMEEEIVAYVLSGEPMDKAGAYGIQAGAAAFVSRVEGCYNNVVGLPLARLVRLLARHGARGSCTRKSKTMR